MYESWGWLENNEIIWELKWRVVFTCCDRLKDVLTFLCKLKNWHLIQLFSKQSIVRMSGCVVIDLETIVWLVWVDMWAEIVSVVKNYELISSLGIESIDWISYWMDITIIEAFNEKWITNSVQKAIVKIDNFWTHTSHARIQYKGTPVPKEIVCE